MCMIDNSDAYGFWLTSDFPVAVGGFNISAYVNGDLTAHGPWRINIHGAW